MTRPWVEHFTGQPGTGPDSTRWAYDLGSGGWGDGQLQRYTDDVANASLTEEGHLALRALRRPDGTITSARLRTQGLAPVRYGRISARIRVPAEVGTWSAFWLLGSDIDDVGWPACGEIDVMEHVGIDPQHVHGTVHLLGHSGLAGGIGSTYDAGVDLHSDFHEYAVDWSEDEIVWLLDGRETNRLHASQLSGGWCFNHEFFVVLNLAVGGDWPGQAHAEPQLPATLMVDFVRFDAFADKDQKQRERVDSRLRARRHHDDGEW